MIITKKKTVRTNSTIHVSYGPSKSLVVNPDQDVEVCIRALGACHHCVAKSPVTS